MEFYASNEKFVSPMKWSNEKLLVQSKFYDQEGVNPEDLYPEAIMILETHLINKIFSFPYNFNKEPEGIKGNNEKFGVIKGI